MRELVWAKHSSVLELMLGLGDAGPMCTASSATKVHCCKRCPSQRCYWTTFVVVWGFMGFRGSGVRFRGSGVKGIRSLGALKLA